MLKPQMVCLPCKHLSIKGALHNGSRCGATCPAVLCCAMDTLAVMLRPSAGCTAASHWQVCGLCLQAARKVKGRGNRRYRPEDALARYPIADPSSLDRGDRRQRDEHRSKHKHHRHRRHRDRDVDDVERAPGQISPDR